LMKMFQRYRQSFLQVVIALCLLGVLYLIGQADYLLFHSLAEIFSIVIAFSIFPLAWNSRRMIPSGYLIFLAISGLFTGMIDLLHTLTFQGMGVIPNVDTDVPTQLWLAARYMQSLSFLVAPSFLYRRLNIGRTVAVFTLIAAVMLLSIAPWGIFPHAYIEGVGLTPFKIWSEYAIFLVYAFAGVLLYRARSELDPGIVKLMLGSIGASMVAELAFTSYISVYGPMNLIGHYFKIIAYFLIYKAIVETSILRPYNIIFRDLKMTEDSLRRSKTWLESQVLERTHELVDANIGLRRQIEERKRVEQALEEQQILLSTVLQQTANGILIRDAQARIVFANPAARRMVGSEQALVDGEEFFLSDELKFYEPDGTLVERENWLMARALRGETINNIEIRLVRPDGSYMDVFANATPLLRNDGTQMGAVLVMADITFRRQAEEALRQANQDLENRVEARTAELNKANQQLAQSNRELQEFAYVASHDLQEPLRKIIAFGGRLDSSARSRLSETEQDYLGRMVNASQRMRKMIDDLLALSRVTTKASPAEQVDLNEVVQEVTGDLELRIEQSGARLEIGPLPTIEADQLQMHQLFQNLIGNALKFIKPGEKPEVRVTANPDGDHVQITVEDNGIGFDAAHYSERIFQPFQRLNGMNVYEGSGIGLAIVNKIIQRHLGSITVESQPGQGAKFSITLPYRHKE
jgi:PAS domain S-box-containing protein